MDDDDERQSLTRLDSLGRPTNSFACSSLLTYAEQFIVDGHVKQSSFVTAGK
jgi:hypothetical protein